MSRRYRFCPLCAAPLELTTIEARPRLRCSDPTCAFVHHDNPTPVVAAIVERDGQVILARGAGWPAGMFGLVTGFLEACEEPEAAVLREVAEELGVAGTLRGFVGMYSFFARNQLILAYHVEVFGALALSEELAEVRFVELDALEPWPFGTGPAVADWLEARRSIA